jgi:NADPH-dependent glutamate synthase beta subunit-like oxidoreductase
MSLIHSFYSMKLDKAIVQRRIDLMAAEGVVRRHHHFVRIVRS